MLRLIILLRSKGGTNMYIHPFVCGVVATILVEVALVVGYAIICGKK